MLLQHAGAADRESAEMLISLALATYRELDMQADATRAAALAGLGHAHS